ncbi:MAG: undecaprenyl-diphosphate phosphatase, partial [Anaerolineales bacterium]|nr:undecaprenyl-diphosphate phosphatase [Anaerolineales bacterium]
IVVGSIPVALIGLPFADFFEEVFSSPRAAAAFLLLTAVLLVLGERALSGRKTIAEMTWTDTLIIGLFQTIALFPGVSRSGSTIVGGLSRGLDRPTAARFSFLLGIPAILGAGLQAILAIFTATSTEFSTAVYIVAFLAAALSGYACIHWLLTWVKNHTLYGFAIYVALFSIVFLLISFLGG